MSQPTPLLNRARSTQQGRVPAPIPCLCGQSRIAPIFCRRCGQQLLRLRATGPEGRYFYKCGKSKGESGCGLFDSFEGDTVQLRTYRPRHWLRHTGRGGAPVSNLESRKRRCLTVEQSLEFCEQQLIEKDAELAAAKQQIADLEARFLLQQTRDSPSLTPDSHVRRSLRLPLCALPTSCSVLHHGPYSPFDAAAHNRPSTESSRSESSPPSAARNRRASARIVRRLLITGYERETRNQRPRRRIPETLSFPRWLDALVSRLASAAWTPGLFAREAHLRGSKFLGAFQFSYLIHVPQYHIQLPTLLASSGFGFGDRSPRPLHHHRIASQSLNVARRGDPLQPTCGPTALLASKTTPGFKVFRATALSPAVRGCSLVGSSGRTQFVARRVCRAVDCLELEHTCFRLPFHSTPSGAYARALEASPPPRTSLSGSPDATPHCCYPTERVAHICFSTPHSHFATSTSFPALISYPLVLLFPSLPSLLLYVTIHNRIINPSDARVRSSHTSDHKRPGRLSPSSFPFPPVPLKSVRSDHRSDKSRHVLLGQLLRSGKRPRRGYYPPRLVPDCEVQSPTQRLYPLMQKSDVLQRPLRV
uniref:Zinc finger GRF-type domain-containing protein n=1 Tax=Mycena chlorophos TaxID=658473 RepID=A0ABQ0KXN2_MYCCL|nr:predicted protein [Mycena chlorophos]